MVVMNELQTKGDMEAQWAGARARVRAYLQALQVADPGRQAKIVEEVFERCAVKHAEHPNECPMVLAMNEVRNLCEQWFGRILSPRERGVKGLVSLFAIDTSKKWPEVFLANDVPEDFQNALRKCHVRAAPELHVTRMVPQPFENPIEEIKTSALKELTKDLPPYMTRAFTFSLSGLSTRSSNRIR